MPTSSPATCQAQCNASKQAAAVFEPVIDRNRCAGKGPCVDACPHDVLAIGTLSRTQRGELSLADRLKAFTHGGHHTFAVHAERCQACGDCVRVCPEHAITLTRRRPAD